MSKGGELNEKNIRLRIIGDRSPFNARLLQQIEDSEALTQNNNGLQLVMALNYSGRWDIIRAAQQLTEQVINQQIKPTEIDSWLFQQKLCLPDLPEPDLLIRTGGEQRISNFMLWQFAYTELFFTEVYWPDFDNTTFQQAIDFYHSKQRRFGRTPEQVESLYA